ncbi:GNAT family N-acetyltransferase [Humidesulfovibrio sp.]
MPAGAPPSLAASWAIVPFDASPQPGRPAGHQAGVVALISTIQRGEFGLSITPQDQPDLMDIPGFYVRGRLGPGLFLVAVDPDGEVCGSIALLNLGGGQGALRKMFVRAQSRGTGLAAALLEALLGWCRGAGVLEIFLGTTERFLAAHRFYEKHGFARIEKGSLPPTFPVMAVDSVFYSRTLAP